ncbi:hypothetical protein JCM8547_001454 [Rhodosporidiobolus lusitaniae]
MSTVVSRMRGRPASAASRGTPISPSDPSARSTRSSGKADHYQPLDGAPMPSTIKAKKSTPKSAPRPEKRYVESSSEDEGANSGDDYKSTIKNGKEAAPKTREAAPPAKKAKKTVSSQLPSPARSTASTSAPSPSPSSSRQHHTAGDSDDVEDTVVAAPAKLASPPKRTSATRITMLPLSPIKTPTKPKNSSPLKKVVRRGAAASESEQEDEEEEQNEDADMPDEAAAAEEQQDNLPLGRSTTPRKTPVKASRTPTSTPKRPRTTSVTPSRSSLRSQRLPPSQADVANAPPSLRNRLVGFHMEDEGYGAGNIAGESESEEEEEEDEVRRKRAAKGKSRAVDQDADEDEVMAEAEEPSFLDSSLPVLPTPPSSPSSSSYLTSPLHLHLSSTLSLLSGQRFPCPFLAPEATSTLPPRDDPNGVMGFPCLEGGFDEWERPLRSALEEVVCKGMGNAVMLLGPRGVGKTMIIDRTLSILSYVLGSSAFATVRLSGLVHTTDRIALRSVAVQLQQQGFGGPEFNIDEGDYSSNSATMTTLLRLLEPSSSAIAASADAASTSTPSNNGEKSKPLILIVDEFDLFAQHPRQSFLYCLLDIVQGNRRRGGVAVVGVSSRVDCLSLLEKRVRSRCQSHVLQIMPPCSLTAFTDLGKRLMKADERAWELERGGGPNGREWAERWNAEVEKFWEGKKVKEYMERLWSVHGNVPTGLRSALAHLFYRLDYRSRLTPSDLLSVPSLTCDLLKPQPRAETRDSVLKTLSVVELTALVACKHLSASTADRQTGFNFEMLYDSYVQHAKRVSTTGGALGVGVKSFSKAALREAFDTLRTHELLLPRSTSSTTSSTSTAGLGGPITVPALSYLSPTSRDPFKLYRCVPWAKDIDREVELRGGECPLVLRRWCKNWMD